MANESRTLAQGIATANQASLASDFDNDRFDAESVAARRDRSVRQILDELARSRRRLFKFLVHVKASELLRRGTHPLLGELTLREFLAVMYGTG